MRSRLMQYRSGPLMQNHSGVDMHVVTRVQIGVGVRCARWR